MKNKRIIALALLFLLVFSSNVFADRRKPEPNAIFMGTVEEVQRNEDNETLIIPNECPKEGEEPDIKKVNPKEFKIQKGDTVFFVLSEAMTKSTPPQAAARAIQLAK